MRWCHEQSRAWLPGITWHRMASHGMAVVEGLDTDICSNSGYIRSRSHRSPLPGPGHGHGIQLCARARLHQRSSAFSREQCSAARTGHSGKQRQTSDGATVRQQERTLTKNGGIPASLPSGPSSNRAAASFPMQPSPTRGGAR